MAEKRKSNRNVRLPIKEGFIPLSVGPQGDLAQFLQTQKVTAEGKPPGAVTTRPPLIKQEEK